MIRHHPLLSEEIEKGGDNGGSRGGRRKSRFVSQVAMVAVACVVFAMLHPHPPTFTYHKTPMHTHPPIRTPNQTHTQTHTHTPSSHTDGFFVNFTTDNLHNAAAQPWNCGYRRGAKDKYERLPLPPEMRPFFNFTTSIRTNLKILVMGDSLGAQLSEYLQHVVLVGSRSNNDNAVVLKRLNNRPSIHVAAPLITDGNNNRSSAIALKGSGAIAGYTMIGMFLPEQHGWAPANFNRGWSLDYVKGLRDYVSNATSSSLTTTTLKKNITLGLQMENYVVSASASGDFDVFVFRIPSPSWIKLEEVTEESLRATLELANQLFGVRVVVFISMGYCNNILTQKDQEEMKYRNRLVFRFARNWTETHNSNNQKGEGGGGVHTVYVLDQGRLIDELMEWNARLLGFDTTTDNYTDVKLEAGKRDQLNREWRISVGQVCGKRVSHNSIDCVRNSVMYDGVHPCMHTIGPRITAGLACQLQCAYHHNYNDITMDDPSTSSSCAEACNDQYMNATAMV